MEQKSEDLNIGEKKYSIFKINVDEMKLKDEKNVDRKKHVKYIGHDLNEDVIYYTSKNVRSDMISFNTELISRFHVELTIDTNISIKIIELKRRILTQNENFQYKPTLHSSDFRSCVGVVFGFKNETVKMKGLIHIERFDFVIKSIRNLSEETFRNLREIKKNDEEKYKKILRYFKMFLKEPESKKNIQHTKEETTIDTTEVNDTKLDADFEKIENDIKQLISEIKVNLKDTFKEKTKSCYENIRDLFQEILKLNYINVLFFYLENEKEYSKTIFPRFKASNKERLLNMVDKRLSEYDEKKSQFVIILKNQDGGSAKLGDLYHSYKKLNCKIKNFDFFGKEEWKSGGEDIESLMKIFIVESGSEDNSKCCTQIVVTDYDKFVKTLESVYLVSEFSSIHKKFDKIDKKFDKIDKKFDEIDKKFENVMKVVTELTTNVSSLDSSLKKLNSKLFKFKYEKNSIKIPKIV